MVLESVAALFLVILIKDALTLDKACPFKPADIIFCLDGSGSEGDRNFKKQLQFISNFTEQFEIGENKTRVSLLSFGTNVNNEFFLNQFYNKADVLAHINNATYPNGETNTHLALNYIRQQTLARNHGGDRNVTKLVIVLTDGRSLEPDATKNAANNLKQNPLVTVMAIGIGSSVDPGELVLIASDSNHTFQVSSFDALHTIQHDLTDTACNVCNGLLSDICFILDSSGSEGSTNFNKQLEFVNMIINEFSFDGISQTRVCVVSFHTGSDVDIHLRQYGNKEAVMTNVLRIPWRNGETMTNLGIDAARHELRHGDATKIAIVLTDGRSTEPDLTSHSAVQLHKSGVETFVVGIGHAVDVRELQIIASDNDHVFKVTNFTLTSWRPFISKWSIKFVPVTAKHVTTTTPIPTTPTTPTTTLPPTTTKAACGLKPADIVFVLDSSDSEGADNFKKEVEFVYDFAAQFSIGTNNVQFSVVTYSSDVRNEFFFKDLTSRNAVLHAIRNIAYMGQGTNTSGALNFVRTQSLLQANGARDNSTKFVIVITDGRSDDQNQTRLEAQQLHLKADVISVGIGPGVDRTELANIASNHRVVTVDSFALLRTVKKQLTDLACESG